MLTPPPPTPPINLKPQLVHPGWVGLLGVERELWLLHQGANDLALPQIQMGPSKDTGDQKEEP